MLRDYIKGYRPGAFRGVKRDRRSTHEKIQAALDELHPQVEAEGAVEEKDVTDALRRQGIVDHRALRNYLAFIKAQHLIRIRTTIQVQIEKAADDYREIRERLEAVRKAYH